MITKPLFFNSIIAADLADLKVRAFAIELNPFKDARDLTLPRVLPRRIIFKIQIIDLIVGS